MRAAALGISEGEDWLDVSTKENVAEAMLDQANQAQQGVLQLLR